MAAGIVYHNITTATGVTFSLACWVPNTALPDVGAIPVSLPVFSDGTIIADATGMKVSGAQIAGPLLAANSTSIVPSTDGAPFRMSQDTSSLLNGNAALTPKFAIVQLSATGDVLALVASKKIRVLAAKLVANGAVNVKWTSGTGPTDLTGLSYFAAAGDGEVLPFNPLGWFETAAGAKLSLNLSASIAVGGHITYVEV